MSLSKKACFFVQVDSYRLEHRGRGPLFSYSPPSSRELSPDRWVRQSGHVGPLDKGVKGQRAGQLQQSNVIAAGRWLKCRIVIWKSWAKNNLKKVSAHGFLWSQHYYFLMYFCWLENRQVHLKKMYQFKIIKIIMKFNAIFYLYYLATNINDATEYTSSSGVILFWKKTIAHIFC